MWRDEPGIAQEPRPHVVRIAGRVAEAGGNAAGEAEGNAERSHSRVEADLVQSRQAVRRKRYQDVHGPRRETEPDDAAEGGDEDRLHQQLPDEADLPGAHRRTDRDLAAPGGAARKQQPRDVGARDQLQEQHGPEEEMEGAAHRAHELVSKLDRPRGPAGVLRGIHLGQARGDQAQLGLGLCKALSRRQPTDHVEVVGPAILPVVRVEPCGNVKFRIGPRSKTVSARKDADDADRAVVEGDRLSDRGGVAVQDAVKEAVADDDHPLDSVEVLTRSEIAAERGLHSESAEERLADGDDGNALDAFVGAQVGGEVIPGRHRGERAGLPRQIEVVRRGPVIVPGFGRHLEDTRELLWVRKRQRLVENAVEH